MFQHVKTWIKQSNADFQAYLERGDGGQEKIASYPSFTALLPYHYFDKESQLFLNVHNAGLLYRITPLTGANEKIAEQLDNLLRTKVSHEFTLHLLLVKHNQVGYALEHFVEQFKNPDFKNLAVLGESLKNYYTKGAQHGFKSSSNIQPRITHTECFVVIDAPRKGKVADIKAKFAQFSLSFEASLHAAKLGFERENADTFLQLLQFFLHHEPDNIYPKGAAYNDKELLQFQVLGRDFDIEDKKDHLLIHNVNSEHRSFETAISVLTIDKLPDEYYLWSNLNNTSNIFHPEQTIPCNHIISVIYKVEESLKAQGKANRKTRDLNKKAKSDYALHVAGTENQAYNWRTFRDDLASQKTRACRILYNVLLFSKGENRERDVEATRSAFAYNGIKLALSRFLQKPYFLVSLPFQFTNHLDKDFNLPTMMWPISSWNATQYMPLLADWQGCGQGILLPTMREQFALIDPFSESFGTNYNIAVTGTSGGGKSFFMQMLMLNVLFHDGDIFIVDVGGSYRKLCEALGGVYLEYKNLAMNPFTHVIDIAAEIDDLLGLFELLACPRDGANDDDRGTLREAILMAYQARGNGTLIDDVQHALVELYRKDKETYPSGRILSKNLERFCQNAEHGKAFNLPSALSPTARLIVVDLKEIEDNQTIRAPVLLSVLSQFQRRMFNSDRSRKKMCVIDEAWAFFTGDAIAANFITKGFRTGRRHKASFVTITQGIDDYYEFQEARAAWENSALKLIFLQEQASLLEHQKRHETFSEYELSLLKSFPKAKEAGFSQVLVKANGISSFHRLFVDPFTKVLLSSDGDDYQKVQNAVQAGKPFLEAVMEVAKAYEGAA